MTCRISVIVMVVVMVAVMIVVIIVMIVVVIIVIVVVIIVIVVVIIVIVVVIIVIVVVIIVIVVMLFAFQCRMRIYDTTLCGFWYDKQIQWLCQDGQSGFDLFKILRAFSGVFETNDVRAGGMQFHRDLCAVKCNIKLANTMFMAAHMPGFFSKGRRHEKR
jgi:hypothetical protein